MDCCWWVMVDDDGREACDGSTLEGVYSKR
jgi:hypothetical protein